MNPQPTLSIVLYSLDLQEAAKKTKAISSGRLLLNQMKFKIRTKRGATATPQRGTAPPLNVHVRSRGRMFVHHTTMSYFFVFNFCLIFICYSMSIEIDLRRVFILKLFSLSDRTAFMMCYFMFLRWVSMDFSENQN